MSIEILNQEKDKLIWDGISNLLKQSHRDLEKVLSILSDYPNIKDTKFNDPGFQKDIFDPFRKSLEKEYSYDNQCSFANLEDRCKDFPFLINMTLENEKIQQNFNEKIKDKIESLVWSLQYPDAECTQYPGDRLSGLWSLYKLYESQLVGESIKESNIPLLLKVFTKRVMKREWGSRFPKVYDLIKLAKASKEEIGNAIYEARNRKDLSSARFNPMLLKYPEFPQEKLKNSDTRKEIRDSWLFNIGEGNIDTLELFMSEYHFIKDEFRIYENIIQEHMQDPKASDKEINNKETKELIQSVQTGLRWFLSRVRSEKAEKFSKYFSTIVKAIPRSEIVDSIYEWINQERWHTTQDILSEKKELLNKFPLSKQEAENYLITNYSTLHNLFQQYEWNDLDVINKIILDLFPWYDLSSIYENPDVRESVISRFKISREKDTHRERGLDTLFVKTNLKISDLEIENIHIE